MSTLDKAIVLAAQMHSGVRDKGGTPYILHPLHVLMEMRKMGATEDELSAAVLHDIVEDTTITLADLTVMGFSEAVVRAVDSVTKRDDESLLEYRQRVAGNPTGRKIKLCDLRHNMDITRLKNRSKLSPKDLARIQVYAEFYDYLVGGAIGV